MTTQITPKPAREDLPLCYLCHQPIALRDGHWRHTTFTPRHPATVTLNLRKRPLRHVGSNL